MKKLLGILAIALLFTVVTNEAKAQISLGGGLAYATDISSPGILVKGTYDIDETWSAAAGFTYYFPKYEGTLKWWSFGVDGRYKFMESDALTLRGVAGLIVTGVTMDFDYEIDDYDLEGYYKSDEISTSASSTEFGVGFGVNAEFAIGDAMALFGELRYNVGGANYMGAQAGILFKLGN